MTQPPAEDAPFDWEQIYRDAPAFRARLFERADPAIAATLRRETPGQEALGTPLPAIRRAVREWLAAHQEYPVEYTVLLAELLWSTGVREDQIAALALIFFHRRAREVVDYGGLESWSREIESRELIDHMAALTGRKLEMTPRLHGTVRNLITSDNPYQRRLALMTLVVASRDPAWEPGLAAMIERLSGDSDPVVQDAAERARARLARMKSHAMGSG
jgi:hypothetical protein